MDFIAIKDAGDVTRNVGVEYDSTVNIATQVQIGFRGNSILTSVDINDVASVAIAARTRRCAMRIQNLGDEEVAFRFAANPVYAGGLPTAAFVVAPRAVEWLAIAVDARAMHAVRALTGSSRVLILEWELP